MDEAADGKVFVVPRERRPGEEDDRARLEAALEEAARRRCPLYLPAGEYVIR